MLDNLKNYSIIILLLAVIGAFFYGKSLVPDPPKPQIVYVEKDSVAAKGEGEAKGVKLKIKRPGLLIDVSADSVGASGDLSLSHELSFMLDNGKPEWAYLIGGMKEVGLEEYLFPIGIGHRIFDDVYLLGNIELDKNVSVKRYGASLLILK